MKHRKFFKQLAMPCLAALMAWSAAAAESGGSVVSSFSDPAATTYFYPVRDRMAVTSLNGTWKFKFIGGLDIPPSLAGWELPGYDAAGWDDIRVPGNWETQGFKRPEYRWIAECTGLYRTSFKYDKAWRGKHVIIRFDGVHFGYELFVNGHKAGEWGSAHNLRQFDITPWLRPDAANVVAVKVNTRSMGWEFDKNDCWAIAGITRDVELFALDNTYIEDVTFTSDITKSKDALIKIKVDVAHFAPDGGQYTLTASITDQQGRHIADFSCPTDTAKKTYTFADSIVRPRLWTAETPCLYDLTVAIRRADGSPVQLSTERVGMRDVRVEGFNLLVNGTPVLVRGVCWNEIDPKLGRSLTYREFHRQLVKMKEANINCIRTAHYPFNPEFFNLCDEMGFYVINEVPFGHGDQFLRDKSYRPELLARAEATVRRDKNHPCVIVWTCGNENPYTSMVEDVVQYVKAKDPSRPRGIPLNAPKFADFIKRPSKNVDIYMGHYLNDRRIGDAVKTADKPIIMTEYAHSLGLSFGELEDKYARILKEEKLIGGCIWDWQDQGLLTDGTPTKQEEKTQTGAVDGAFALPINSKVTQGVWLDSLRYIDTFGDQGTDGVVYADGHPQEDFFLVRKVYSPVAILTDSVTAGAANAVLKVDIENRFDFTPLNGYRAEWRLTNLNRTLGSGSVWLSAKPKSRQTLAVEAAVPADAINRDLTLCIEIVAPDGHVVYEKNVAVDLPGGRIPFISAINALPKADGFKASASKRAAKAKVGKAEFAVSADGTLTLSGPDGRTMTETPLLLRVGRKETVTSESQAIKSRYFWTPYLLTPEIESFATSKDTGGAVARLKCRWNRGEDTAQYVRGDVTVRMNANGTVRIDYTLSASDSAKNSFTDLGLALRFKPAYDTFRWLGMGPFASVPGKSAFNERASWRLHSADLHFNGNRSGVDIAALTGGGVPMALYGAGGNIGIENAESSVVVSQNINAADYGDKFNKPRKMLKAADVKNAKGSLTLMPVVTEAQKAVLTPVFGAYPEAVPEQPYLKSYGW